jgi:rhodanese-related sulfurtransferase
VPTQASSQATPTLDLLLPITEAGVPRVTVEKAKAAFDAGQAVIVDIRTAEAYASRHISGAILIPLADIERDPGAVPLDKTKWIITYCT